MPMPVFTPTPQSVTDRILATRWALHNTLTERAITRLAERIHGRGGVEWEEALRLAKESVARG